MTKIENALPPSSIAIIGMAARLPGARSIEQLWKNLLEGRSGISYFDTTASPPDGAGKIVPAGAVLQDIDLFDAPFFDIPPREAVTLDPQRRFFLECAWEALESAGIDPSSYNGSIGVYAGTSASHYLSVLPNVYPDAFDGFQALLGNDKDYLASYLAYKLNLRGPCVGVQTACSTSLVAVHFACSSLLARECDVVLAGGVTIRFPQGKGYVYHDGFILSPDGRCRAFDAAANGTVFGNGVGVVVLKRLEDAIADGDRIRAIIRGTAVNSDGSAKVGFTAPSVTGQAHVVAEALELAGVEPDSVQYIETHGTATPLGDSIEVAALKQVFRSVHEKGRIALGALKSSVGHLETAAGVAGLIKTVLAIENAVVPANPALERPNPALGLAESPFYIRTETHPWPATTGPRRAGVSSFGIGGTNAHVVVEQAPHPQGARPRESTSYLLPLSAKSPEALSALAKSYQEWLVRSDEPLHHLAYTASLRRSHHGHRLAVVGTSKDELAAALKALAEGAAPASLATGEAATAAPKVVFVFPGQGSQWVGMGRKLRREEPAFRDALAECDKAIRKEAGFSVIEELDRPEATSRLSELDVVQPVLFATEVALAALWRAWGVVPAAVVGHSMGEVAAAFVAGALSMQDAAAIICRRSRLARKVAGRGAMAMVELTLPDAERALVGYEDRLSVAVSNGPRSTVIAGDPAALEEVLARLERDRVFCKRVKVDFASHSPQVEPLRAELLTALASVAPKAGRIAMRSTVTGERVRGDELSARYWADNLRKPVLFSQGVAQWIAEGHTIFLEMSPHPILLPSVEENLREAGAQGVALPSTRRGQDERQCMLHSLGALFAQGCPVAWKALFPEGGRVVELPAYPWQRQRYWVDGAKSPAPSTTETVAGRLYSGFHSVESREADPLNGGIAERYLTFAPFRDVLSGFSWIDAFADQANKTDSSPARLTLEAQRELRRLVFRHVDFGSCTSVLDIGCGYATDLMVLARRHPQLSLEGYTISKEQAESDVERVRQAGLEGRVKIHWADSGKDEFPGTYDVAFGFEVAHHIRDKHALFGNISRHLREGGELALADFISNTAFQIEHEASSSFFLLKEEWVEVLSKHSLLVVDCVDISQEVANFMHDPDFDATFQRRYRDLMNEELGGVVAAWHRLGLMLRRGLASYILLSAQKRSGLTVQELEQRNRAALDKLIPYEAVVPSAPRDPLEECLLETQWRRKEFAAQDHGLSSGKGTWLIYSDRAEPADREGLGEALVARLTALGRRCILVLPAASYRREGPDRIYVDPSRREDLQRVLREGFGEDGGCEGVVHLPSLSATPTEQLTAASLRAELVRSAVSAAYLAQALVRHNFRDMPRLFLVTRGAQSVQSTDAVAVSQAPILGLGKSIPLEHPELRCTRIDLQAEAGAPSAQDVERLLRELGSKQREDQIALRGPSRYVARIARTSFRGKGTREVVIRADRTYLITGGLGGLGLSLAEWLVQQGARTLVLVGRSGPREGAGASLRSMEAAGAKVRCVQADVSDERDVAALFASIRAELPPLGGIVHAAMVLDDHALLEQSAESFQRVFAAKALGAWNLHRQLESTELDFFVLYSSATGLVGSAGQANYCAANGFLDALCRERARRGLPALSIQWGGFAEIGQAAAPEHRGRRLASRGWAGLTPAEGLDAFRRLLADPRPEVGVLRFNPRQWIEFYPSMAGVPFYSELVQQDAAPERTPASSKKPVLERLRAARAGERRSLLEQHLSEIVGTVLQLDASRIDRATPLSDLGMDSLTSIILRNRFEALLGVKLSATILFTYPTVAALAEHLLGVLELADTPAVAAVERPAPEAQSARDDVVIIGLACRFPAGGSSPEAFWHALEQGVDGIRRIPVTRWPADAIEGDNPATRWAGLIDSVDRFDAPFFGISPREAAQLDPQQRLLLEISWEALENAGLPVEPLMGSKTGVFLGMSSFDYQQLVQAAPTRDAYSMLGGMASTASGRISYTFGFQGPCATLDTACSSSLTAVHWASQSLRDGECDLALAGGVNVILSARNMALATELQAMAPDGRCKTFDADANGFVLGEGCGIAVLKRRSDAERDGDRIWAVVRASRINQDGRSTGLTAPNVLSQQALLRQVLEAARVSPEEVGYVEVHGTGTSLGDPIEFEALRAVLGKPRGEGERCVLGAAKTNIGHLAAAAGVAGLIKAALCLRHQAIPKNLHYKTLNPRMSLDGTPFVIPTETIPWKANGKPRRAGVSSFGISGTNAHVLLEEAPRVQERRWEASSYLLPLSAKTPEALVALARSYSQWLARQDEPLHHVAYTASVRRSSLECRLCVLGTDRDEVAAALGAFAAGEVPPSVVTGKAAQTGQTAPKIVFVFPGHGSQWVGMGRTLYREEPVFRAALDACDQAIRKEAAFSVVEELDRPEQTSRIGEIDIVQPVLFALGVALAALWRARGVEPSVVVGHSMGEVAAAYVAGALSLDDAAAIICRRSRLLRTVSGHGAMALIELNLSDAEDALRGYGGRLSIAASNGPGSTVIAGEPGALAEVVDRLEQQGLFCKRLEVDVASHGPQMEPLLEELLRALAGISPRAGSIPLRSTVTGERVRGDELSPGYWADNLRKPVLFSQAITQCIAEGHTIFVEMSPQPILLPWVEEILWDASAEGTALASLVQGQDERQTLLLSLGELFVRGCPVAWKALFPEGGRVVDLPTYPWQQERYWIDGPSQAAQAAGASAARSATALAPHEPTRREDGWFLDTAWEPAAMPAAQVRSGRFLLLGEANGVGAALRAALESAGHAVAHAVSVAPGAAPAAAGGIPCDDSSVEGVRALLRGAFGGQPPTAVVHLRSLDGQGRVLDVDAVESALVRGVDSVLHTVQALAALELAQSPRLWLVTRGAQAVGASAVEAAQAPLLGMARTILAEHPELRCICVDIEAAAGEASVAALQAELLGDDDEQETAWRAGQRFVSRIVHKRLDGSSQTAPSVRTGAGSGSRIRSDRSYLVTGGLGGLGLSVAGWLAERGAGHIVLMGRSGATSAAQRAAVAAMQASGSRVTIEAASIAEREAVAGVLRSIETSTMPLAGVIHAAGVLDDGLLLMQSPARFRTVLAPKVRGALHLHALTRDMPLDFFVLYSSAGGIFGAPGQANYTAANAFLDALAHHRRASGLPALSIDWGLFADVGLPAAQANRGARLVSSGITSLTPADGILALERLLESEAAQVVVTPLDILALAQSDPTVAAKPRFSRLLAAAKDTLPTQPGPHPREGRASPEAGAVPSGHPLLGQAQVLSTRTFMRLWETRLDVERLPWVADHRVQGEIVFPGTGYLEMALSAASEAFPGSAVQLGEVAFLETLTVHEGHAVDVQLVMSEEVPGRIQFHISSRAEGAARDAWTLHARGVLRTSKQQPVYAPLDLAALRARLGAAVPVGEVYAGLADSGVGYGPAFRGLVEVWRGHGEAFGRVRLPDAGGSSAEYSIHPALLDACFHVMAAGVSDMDKTPWLPVEVGSVRLFQRSAREVFCHARSVDGGATSPQAGDRRTVELVISDAAGEPVAVIEGFVVQRLAGASRRKEDDWFLDVAWEPAAVPAPKVRGGRFWLLGEGHGLGAALRAALESEGHHVVAGPLDDASVEGHRGFLQRELGAEPPTAVVHLRSLDGDAGELGGPAVDAALGRGTDGVLPAVQALLAMGYAQVPRLWLVSRGAQATGQSRIAVEQAPLLGLARTIVAEHPALRCTCLDLDPVRSDAEVLSVRAELLADDAEQEVAWRSGGRLVSRIVRKVPQVSRRERIEAANGRAFRLELETPGVLDNLALRLTERRMPGPGEVEIAVEAAGLNFADVLRALGLYPGLGDAPITLGGECAGRIVGLGEGVEGLHIGQDVVAFTSSAFSSHATVSSRFVVPRPAILSAAQAAALPGVLVTAWYALVHLARLTRGERVLIHSATGGIGLAAVQIARHLGAEIFATAGSPEKRAWLREQGIVHVMDSRSLDFAPAVQRATNGQGVDVVLNSLSGAAIEASLSALAPDGRFIELGKTDIYAERGLGLSHFKKSLSFSAVDIVSLTQRRPQRLAALLSEVMDRVAQGVLTALPVECFPISRAADAFRKMAQAKHIGKLVLTLDEPNLPVRVRAESRVAVRRDRSYLVTAGLGRLGLSVAQWLADRGAGHIVLVDPVGAARDGQPAAIAALEAAGSRVTIEKADVAEREDVARVVEHIAASTLPLAGIVHVAGLPDEAGVMQQSPLRFRRGLAAQALGALHLHALTADLPIELFVLYSAAAGLLGAPGQASHAAASALLDALAHHRRSLGLPATSIDWAGFSDADGAAASDSRGAGLMPRGLGRLTLADGLVVLERLLESDVTQAAVLPLQVRAWAQANPAVASLRRLQRLVTVTAAASEQKLGLRERLVAAVPAERALLILEFLREEVARVLHLVESKLDVDAPLIRLGMDSLMSLELRHRLQRTVGVDVKVRELLSGATLTQLVPVIQQQLRIADSETAAAAPQPAAIEPAASPPAAPQQRIESPLSIGQEALWFIHKSAPEGVGYNLGFVLRIESDGDPAPALRRALQALVDRHSLLRTWYGAVDGVPRQIVHSHHVIELPEVDATELSEAEVIQAATRLYLRPYDLEVEGALRLCLYRRRAGEVILLVGIHHIAIDGWSLWLLLDELLRVYGVDGKTRPLPPPTRTYQDFVAWQNTMLAARGEEMRRFWLDELQDAPLVLQLPTDRPRPPIQTFRGATLRRRVDPALVSALRDFARACGATLNTVFLAAYQLLLHRYTDQDDFCIGLGAASREQEELADVFGYMTNQLVLRTRIESARAVEVQAFVRTTQARLLSILNHQEYPFARLVSELLTERDPSRPPVVQAMYVYQQVQGTRDAVRQILDGTPVTVRGTRFTGLPRGEETSEGELLLEVFERGASMDFGLHYNTDLFEEATIERMAGHFEILLDGIARDHLQPISQLSLFETTQRQQLLAAGKGADAPYSEHACIHHLFEAQVDRDPDALALVDHCTGRRITISYAELERRANQVANHLIRLGVGPETIVGLCIERGAELVVCMLGVLKAGGALVVLDPELPHKRLTAMLEDTCVPVLLTRERLLRGLPTIQAQVVDLDRGLAEESTHRPRPSAGPDNLAYVLYTSGSTGLPNGALIEHRGLVNSIESHIRIMETGPGARHAHILSFSFDAAMAHLFVVICAGGTSHLVPRDGDSLSQGLTSLIDSEAITHSGVAPSMLAALPDAEWPSLRTLVVGGERCSASIVSRWGAHRRLLNLYGPTETSILATFALCIADGKDPPIGRPIANMQAYVVDRWGHLAPLGAAGELWLGGVGVGRGYLNRPSLTAQKFIDNPFGPGRIYRTGDRVRQRLTASGEPVLEFIGRMDNQVKIRGRRVELGEIENVLRATQRVRDAVVTVHDHAAEGDKRLVAYVTPLQVARTPAWELEQIEAWKDMAVERAAATGEPDLSLDLRGWKSSYTGKDLPHDEMQAWVDATVARILALAPRDVLEIGCGTGMLLARIAPQVGRYRGTDLARHAIEHVRWLTEKLPGLQRVHVTQQPAHDFTGLAEDRFDTVVLNSVVQYFPSAHYLFDVIAQVMAVVKPSGQVFFGDVRSLALLETYHASVQRHRAGGSPSRKELQGRVQRALIDDNELVVHPRFFTSLRAAFPQITEVEVAPERGSYLNELSLFRYDVVLRLGPQPPASGPIEWHDAGRQAWSLDALRGWITRATPGATLGLRGVRNARLREDNALLQWLRGDGHGPWVPAAPDASALDPEALYRLAAELPCRVRLSWAEGRADGSFELLVTAGDGPTPPFPLEPPQAPDQWSDWTNNPLLGRSYRELAADLNRQVRDALPPYCVPSAIVVLPALPLTSHGKVDLRALPLPEILHDVSAERAEPRTETERLLVELWARVLGLPRIGINDNFFELGGDSILSIQISSRAQALGLELRTSQIFEHQTIAALAAALDGARMEPAQEAGSGPAARTSVRRPAAAADASAPGDSPFVRLGQDELRGLLQIDDQGRSNIEAIYPLVSIQPQILSDTLGSTSAAMWMTQVVLTFEGMLDAAALKAAWAHLLRRHPLLRSRIAWKGLASPVQTVLRDAPLRWSELDWRDVPPQDQQARIEQLCEELTLLGMSVEVAPMLRHTLVRLAEQRYSLVYDSHHVLADGWSLGVILRDLSTAYEAARTSRLREPPPSDTYERYLRWLEDLNLDGARDYWRRTLRGFAEPTPLPGGRAAPGPQRAEGMLTTCLDAKVTADLKAMADAARVTLATVFEGAWALLLGGCAGRDDVLYGVVVSGRDVDVPGIEEVVGHFLYSLPVRVRISDGEDLWTWLRTVQAARLEAQRHQHLSLREIQQASDVPLGTRLFNTFGVFENFPFDLGLFRSSGLGVTLKSGPANVSVYPLSFGVMPMGKELHFSLNYYTELFDPQSIAALAARFEQLLRAMASALQPRMAEVRRAAVPGSALSETGK